MSPSENKNLNQNLNNENDNITENLNETLNEKNLNENTPKQNENSNENEQETSKVLPCEQEKFEVPKTSEAILNASKNEESTIFQKHIYERKKAKLTKKGKTILTSVVALLLVVVCALSAFLLPKFLKVETSDNTSSLATAYTTDVLADFEFGGTFEVKNDAGEIVEYLATTIDYVSFKNQKDTYKLISQSEIYTNDKDELKFDLFWDLDGVKKDYFDREIINAHLEAIFPLKAAEKFYDETSDFGFDKPSREMSIVYFEVSGIKTINIIFGKNNALGDTYAKISGYSEQEDGIYLIKADSVAAFDVISTQFAVTTMVDKIKQNDKNKDFYFVNDVLARFDTIKINSKQYPSELIIGMNDGVSADYMPYKVTFPYVRPADEDPVESVLDLFSSGLEADAVYCYNPTEKQLEEYGFDDPLTTVYLKVADDEVKIIIGKDANGDGNYYTAMVEGKPQIFQIASSALTTNLTSINGIYTFFSQNIVMETITEIKNVEITAGKLEQNYALSHGEPNDSGYIETTVKLNGNLIERQSFSDLYFKVLSLETTRFIEELKDESPILTIDISFYKNDAKNRVVEFYPYDNNYCAVAVDGHVYGCVVKSSVTSIIDNATNITK